MVQEFQISGVAFTRDPNTGGHYFVINYDNSSGCTNTVTPGNFNNLKVLLHSKSSPPKTGDIFKNLYRLLNELETIFDHDSLDIEFAIDRHNKLYLLQVRPLILNTTETLSRCQHHQTLQHIAKKIKVLSQPHPYILGANAVFGIMPDWNPAEIIGIRPRPLAFSLYKALVTDGVWSYQCDNYGYRNLRSFPLMHSFGGLPYIDVRVSFNSFVPADIPTELAKKLVNHYVEQLVKTPNNHDKVEFAILQSCYTFDLPNRLNKLKKNGFTADETTLIAKSLRKLTNRIINLNSGLWRKN